MYQLSNLSVQVTARAEPLWRNVGKSKIYHFGLGRDRARLTN